MVLSYHTRGRSYWQVFLKILFSKLWLLLYESAICLQYVVYLSSQPSHELLDFDSQRRSNASASFDKKKIPVNLSNSSILETEKVVLGSTINYNQLQRLLSGDWRFQGAWVHFLIALIPRFTLDTGSLHLLGNQARANSDPPNHCEV